MKILRKITPLLILMIISIIWAIRIFFSESDGEGWGLLIVFSLIGFAVGFLLVDLVLKRFIKNWKKVMLIESGIVLLFMGWYQYQNRPLIFELPKNFSEEYVTIIYNVDKENKLGISNFTLWKKIKVPQNGIILTSSNISETLPKTEFKSADGEYFNSDNSQKIFIKLSNSKIDQNGHQYDLRTWKISKGNFIISMENDFEEYKTELKKILEKKPAGNIGYK